MDLHTFRSLLEPPGLQVLAAAAALDPREADFLRLFTALSRQYPAELARAALETAILRGEAKSKFPFSERLYFTRQALEQASSFEVSSYRAERFRPFNRVADLGCSIGGDTLALAAQGFTLGVDIDPLRLSMAAANLRALGLEARSAFIQADLLAPLPLSNRPEVALFFDPARRTGGRRVFSVRAYQPPLAVLHNWLESHPALGVKISPGVKLDELSSYQAEIEFISLRGELKEAVLWFGPLQTARRRATVLPGPHTLAGQDPFPRFSVPDLSGASRPAHGRLRGESSLPLSEPLTYLYEPDPAILRAGLVEDLGRQLGAAQLDADIAYLTASRALATPFARLWPVADWFPFGLKKLRLALKQRQVERVVVKKRGSPIQPESLIRDLKLPGDPDPAAPEWVVFLTHLRGRPVAILSPGEIKS